MPRCSDCGGKIGIAISCVRKRENQVPFGRESNSDWAEHVERCPDCGVTVGGYHHPECHIQECPKCQELLVSCSCESRASLEPRKELFVNRRKHERKTLQKYCSIECLSEEWSCSARIKDLSDGGIGIETFKVPKIKDEVHVYMLGDAGEQVKRKAVVAWSRSVSSSERVPVMGLRFV
jgi:hypothetical protein